MTGAAPHPAGAADAGFFFTDRRRRGLLSAYRFSVWEGRREGIRARD